MPPLPSSKSQVPITYEVRSIERKTGGPSLGRSASINTPSPPTPLIGRSNAQFPSRFRGPPKPAEKRIITFGAPVVSRPAPESRPSLAIEGSRTGEEIVVQLPAQRKPAEPPSEDLTALRKQLTQAKAENRNLSGKLSKRKCELEHCRQLMNIQLDELQERRRKEIEFWCERDDILLQRLVQPLRSADNTKKIRELQTVIAGLEKELKEVKTAFETEKTTLLRQLEVEKQTPKNDDEIARLKARIAELESTLTSERSRFTMEKQILEAEKAGVELVLSQTATKLRDLEKLRAEEEFLVAQSRLFVKNVCQPGFNVVKDTSLEPVEKNRSSPTGYVLVPLIILLHGYTLLPNDQRQAVIEGYERRAAAL